MNEEQDKRWAEQKTRMRDRYKATVALEPRMIELPHFMWEGLDSTAEHLGLSVDQLIRVWIDQRFTNDTN